MATALFGASGAAHAGKPERDKQADTQKQAAAAQKTVSAACGCDVPIHLKWDTFKTVDDMSHIYLYLSYWETAAQHQCKSAEDKKALCDNVSAIEISYSKEPTEPTIANKVIACWSSNTLVNPPKFSAILNRL